MVGCSWTSCLADLSFFLGGLVCDEMYNLTMSNEDDSFLVEDKEDKARRLVLRKEPRDTR